MTKTSAPARRRRPPGDLSVTSRTLDPQCPLRCGFRGHPIALVSGDFIDLRAFWRIAEKRFSAIRRPGLVSYNERRKFKMSCARDRLRLLKLRRPPLASEPQYECWKRS
jgi:hypothetical protein